MTDDKYKIKLDVGTWAATLGLLIRKGLQFGTYIDIGCADGYFGLAFWGGGLFRHTTVINIDANPVYEPSLRKIRAAIGGDYRICAVDDRDGSIDLYTSTHPYWASAAAPDDPYWHAIYEQRGEKVSVPCRRLDSIIEELAPKPPYAIKLDVQGLEARVLRGATRSLASTAVVVCEVLVHNFSEIHAELEKAGFALHDLTESARTPEHALGWFYAAYLHRDYAAFGVSQHWPETDNAAIIAQQQRRREDLLARIEKMISRIKADGGP